MSLLTDFKTRFPELTNTQTDLVIPTLEQVWPCYYGGDYSLVCDREVILNLVAHLFVDETSAGSGSLKSVSSKSVGSVSVSYANATYSGGEGYDFFKTTKYGKRYLMLTQQNSGAVFV